MSRRTADADAQGVTYRDECPSAGLGGVREVIHPQEGERARRIISRSRARGTGKYPSWKLGRMVHWESPYERIAYHLLDADPTVRSFQEQPLIVRYVMNGKIRTHYPDALVQWADGTQELWEIKPDQEAIRPEVFERTGIMTAGLRNFGYQYRVITAQQLAKQPRLSNVLTLLKLGRRPLDHIEREIIRRLLVSTPALSWASALAGDLGPRGRDALCRLTLEGTLRFELDQPLNPHTQFRAIAVRTKEASR